MKKILTGVLIVLSQYLCGQTDIYNTHPGMKLDLTIVDLPYQMDAIRTVNNGEISLSGVLRSYANPGMQQSLFLTSDLYSAAHYGLDRLFKVEDNYFNTEKVLWHILSLFATDYIMTYLPGGDGWLHEEYHRAVMSRFHVNSFNDMNTFPIGKELVSVNHVLDANLIRFKNESPQDFIRMHAAGIEGEYLLVDRLQRHNFFYEQHRSHELMYFLAIFNAASYVNICSNPDFTDDETNKLNQLEGNMYERDFTGFDFTAWVYDLYYPDEDYESRGLHPLGNGIDRYIKTTDLGSSALAYLDKQGKLQLLNLLSPMIFGKRSISINDEFAFNFAVRNYLTSFGNDISLNVLLKARARNMVFAYHHASNYVKSFPALEVELFESPYLIADQVFLFTPRFIVGLQPQNQQFRTREADLLTYASCRIDWLSSNIHPYVEFNVKTKGWVAGNEFLDSHFGIRLGLSARIL